MQVGRAAGNGVVSFAFPLRSVISQFGYATCPTFSANHGLGTCFWGTIVIGTVVGKRGQGFRRRSNDKNEVNRGGIDRAHGLAASERLR